MKILVCDDDAALASLIRFKLSRENIGDITMVHEGRQALAELKSHTFDLVITDIYMPYHSGLEIIAFIRNDLKMKIPIIVLSAEGLEETVLQAFDVGADEFISKPFSPTELMVRVKRILRMVS